MDAMNLIGLELNDVFVKQSEKLSAILAQQHVVHDAVTERNWAWLEIALKQLDILTTEVAELDKKMQTLLEELKIDEVSKIYELSSEFSTALRDELLSNFRTMHQKLNISRIENEALQDYIRISKTFLDEVMEVAVPNCGKVYSRSGEIVKTMPNSLVYDSVL